MTKKTLFGKNIDKYIEFSPEEKIFLREFKLLLLEGLVAKKYCGLLRYVFRTFRITYDLNKLIWNSSKISGSKSIMLMDIVSIGDSESLMFSDVLKKRIVVIKHRIPLINDESNQDYNNLYSNTNYREIKDTVLEFADEETRNLFLDGLKILVKEYRQKQLSK
jgi:hypothetical protein